MSITFFVIPYKPTEWKTADSDLRINIDEFQEKLVQAWPTAKFELTPENGLLWSIPEDSSAGFFGGIQSDHQIISFGPGGWKTFKDFILWYRLFIPLEYRLFFFNSSSWNSLEITSIVTREDIDNFLSQSTGVENEE